MPTVSTVERTTSARPKARSDERTVAKSPPYPPAASRQRVNVPPATRAGRGRRALEVVLTAPPARASSSIP